MSASKNVEKEEKFSSSDFIEMHACPICESKDLKKIGDKSTIHPQSTFSVSLNSCNDCRHWSTNPMPNAKLLSRLYGEASLSVLGAGWSAEISSQNDDSSMVADDDWVVVGLSSIKPGNFLEIGPGDGSLLRKIRSLGWNAFGVDLGDYAKGFQVVSSSDQLPAGLKFDVIVFRDVLEHVADPSEVLEHYLSYLTDDAILFVSVPWSESKRAKQLSCDWEMVRPLGHLNYFSIKSLHWLLGKSCFVPVSTNTENIYGPYWRRMAVSAISMIYSIVSPSRWNFFGQRFKKLAQEISLFPGDPQGDQLHVISRRNMR